MAARAAFAWLVVVLACAHAMPGAFEEVLFADIKDLQTESVAVFYRSSEHDSGRVLTICSLAARVLATRLPNMRFLKIDGDVAANAQLFQAAQFHAGQVL
jgi:hypothetical protein